MTHLWNRVYWLEKNNTSEGEFKLKRLSSMSQRERVSKFTLLKKMCGIFSWFSAILLRRLGRLRRKGHECFSPVFPALLSTRGKENKTNSPSASSQLTRDLPFLLKDAHPHPPTVRLGTTASIQRRSTHEQRDFWALRAPDI